MIRVALLVLLAVTTAVAQDERITDYRSQIVVSPNGAIDVEETIAVVAAGENIKHGIYRDFPTTYDGPWFTRRIVPFDHVRVHRDGRDEPFRLEEQDNGMRAYAGSADVELPSGPHTYVFDYRTADQLGFFADHDELYWNVTGNGWAFPIDRVTATVVLPKDVPRRDVRLEAYTGSTGDKGTDFTSTVDLASGLIRFTTTQPLAAYQGLTIVVSFPKGFVTPPTPDEVRDAFIRANKPLLVAGAGAVVVVLYFLGAWMLMGRDPRRGTIIPRFEPPKDMSPACLRYVARMRFDEECFAAALLGLAAKGAVRIDEKGGDYTVVRQKLNGDRPLSIDERRVMSTLLSSNQIVLEQSNHTTIRGAIRALNEALKLAYEGTMFVTNRWWFIPGAALAVLTVLAASFSGSLGQKAAAGFMCLWLSGWTFGVLALGKMVVQAFGDLMNRRGVLNRIGGLITTLLTTAFFLPFFAGELFGLYSLGHVTTQWMGPIIVVLIGLAFLFYHLLKRPTVAGRALMDEIEGFKMYLVTAESDVIRKMNAPPRNLALYERLFPYAVALDVENEWTEQFADQIAAAAAAGDRHAYSPSWYHGNSFGSGGLAGMGASMSHAISSSSTAPGSSSGSSGGGSSGGGGGGGGGGGW